jgi:dTDP-4-dehydrorhamnose 3,5-epimerase
MEFIHTTIKDLILIKPTINGDERGFFLESYKKSAFIANGIKDEFVQDNHSKSSCGVLRGLHYQINPKAQGKLLRCVQGAIFDVAVDIRRNSPTFGQWLGFELSETNKQMLYVPPGFAHGFLTLSSTAELLYKTTDEYSPEHDRGISYADPAIGIIWPKLEIDLLLSEKDKNQPLLKDAEMNFVYGEI